MGMSDKGIPPDIVERAGREALILNEQAPLCLELAIVGVYFGAILLTVVGYLGLFLFWRPARYMFLCGVILQALCEYSARWSVTNSYENVVDTIEVLFNGVLLALIFCGPAKEFFSRGIEKNCHLGGH